MGRDRRRFHYISFIIFGVCTMWIYYQFFKKMSTFFLKEMQVVFLMGRRGCFAIRVSKQ